MTSAADTWKLLAAKLISKTLDDDRELPFDAETFGSDETSVSKLFDTRKASRGPGLKFIESNAVPSGEPLEPDYLSRSGKGSPNVTRRRSGSDFFLRRTQ